MSSKKVCIILWIFIALILVLCISKLCLIFMAYDAASGSKIPLADVFKWGSGLFVGAIVGPILTYFLNLYRHQEEREENLREVAIQQMDNCINANRLNVTGYIPCTHNKSEYLPAEVQTLLNSEEKNLVLQITANNNENIFPNGYEVTAIQVTCDNFATEQRFLECRQDNSQILICFTESEGSENAKKDLFNFLLNAFYHNRKKEALTELSFHMKIEFVNSNNGLNENYIFEYNFSLTPNSGITEMGKFEIRIY